MATVKEKVAGIKEMEDRIEAGVAELHRGTQEIEKEIHEETDWMRKGIAEMHRGASEIEHARRELEARFDNYARDDFWG